MSPSMKETDTYLINEIFYSLQGEGFYSGRPAVFIRFAGCNLRCPFCDTDFSVRERLDAAALVARAVSLRGDTSASHAAERPLLVLTGGEPSLQVDDALVSALHEAGFYIAVETNGTHALPEGIDWVTCSPKDAPVVLTQADELKVVYRGQDVESLYGLIEARHHYLQPCDLTYEVGTRQPATACPSRPASSQPASTLKETVAYILSHPHWRLSLQIHKLLGIP